MRSNYAIADIAGESAAFALAKMLSPPFLAVFAFVFAYN